MGTIFQPSVITVFFLFFTGGIVGGSVGGFIGCMRLIKVDGNYIPPTDWKDDVSFTSFPADKTIETVTAPLIVHSAARLIR